MGIINTMATIYRDTKSGYWYINYITVDGKRVRRSLGTRDRKLAELKLKEIELELAKGRLGFTSDIELGAFLEKFLEWSKAVKARETYRTDLKTAENLTAYFGSRTRLSRINTAKAEGFKLFLVEHKGYSKTTANIRLRHAKAMFSKAVEWGHLQTNPFSRVKPFKESEKLKYLTPQELKALFSVIEDELHKAYFVLIFYTGMRASEAVNLGWEDVDLDKNIIIVRNKANFHTKTYRERVIPIHPDLKPWLEKLKRINRNKVIHYAHPSNVNKLFRMYSKKAGVYCTPHKLRHTFATLLASKGVSIRAIQELLGHTRISTTEIYAKMASDYLSESVKQLNLDV